MHSLKNNNQIHLTCLTFVSSKVLKAIKSGSNPTKYYTCDIFGMHHLMVPEHSYEEDDQKSFSSESVSSDINTKDDDDVLQLFKEDDKITGMF